MKMVGDEERRSFLVFTYGTLKRGLSNHALKQDLVATGDALFIGPYTTSNKYPLVCGPYRVPFLLRMPGSGQRVDGELYAVSRRGLARMDELEGTSRGHYERLPINLVPAATAKDDDDDDEDEYRDKDEEEVDVDVDVGNENDDEAMVTCAEAYYAHSSYMMELWKKAGRKGLRSYSAKAAKGYVKRKDRPQHITFLEQIRLFLSQSQSQSHSFVL